MLKLHGKRNRLHKYVQPTEQPFVLDFGVVGFAPVVDPFSHGFHHVRRVGFDQ